MLARPSPVQVKVHHADTRGPGLVASAIEQRFGQMLAQGLKPNCTLDGQCAL